MFPINIACKTSLIEKATKIGLHTKRGQLAERKEEKRGSCTKKTKVELTHGNKQISKYNVDFSFCFNYPIMTQGLFSLRTEPNIDLSHKLSPRSPTMAFSSVRENVTPTLS